ncbi:MAG: NAD(P)H-dependent oxidoreductase [Akkermansiaceae bacterium]|nr:NAD(P)H-dependent oxidoreductase [Akkermansiaceae bacterium]
MSTKRILAFSGSLRQESYNHKLLTIAVDGARQAGAEVTLIRLKAYPLPIFDQDLEDAEGMPEAGAKLKKLFDEHDAFLIASPEYNGGMSAALKNAIDWVSRATEEDEPPLKVLANKTAAILAASPGGYGGSRGLELLRKQLENIRIEVLENQITVPKVDEVMEDDGSLKDEDLKAKVLALGAELAKR